MGAYTPPFFSFFLESYGMCTMCTHETYAIDFMNDKGVHIGKKNVHRVHI